MVVGVVVDWKMQRRGNALVEAVESDRASEIKVRARGAPASRAVCKRIVVAVLAFIFRTFSAPSP